MQNKKFKYWKVSLLFLGAEIDKEKYFSKVKILYVIEKNLCYRKEFVL